MTKMQNVNKRRSNVIILSCLLLDAFSVILYWFQKNTILKYCVFIDLSDPRIPQGTTEHTSRSLGLDNRGLLPSDEN